MTPVKEVSEGLWSKGWKVEPLHRSTPEPQEKQLYLTPTGEVKAGLQAPGITAVQQSSPNQASNRSVWIKGKVVLHLPGTQLSPAPASESSFGCAGGLGAES